MALLTGAITYLALSGAVGLPPGDFTGKALDAGGRPDDGTFTRLYVGGSPLSAETDYSKAEVTSARPDDGTFTRLSPTATASRPWGDFSGKAETNVADKVASDSIRVFVTEGPVSDVEIAVTESLRPSVTDSRAIGIGRSVSDTIRPQVADVVQFVSKVGDTPKAGAESVRVYVAESASIAAVISVSDTVTPVVTDANTLLDKSDAKIVSDTITVVLTDAKLLQTANAVRDFAVVDTITARVTDTARVAAAGDVDRIDITSRPMGQIRIREK